MIALLDDPLRPSPDEARDLLRRELLKPEYQQDNPIERLLDWISRLFEDSVGAASGLSSLSTFALIVVFLALVLALVLLLSRARRAPRRSVEGEAVLPDVRVSAAEHRRLAEAALAAGRFGEAVVEGFRALTARQVERGRLDDLPGATAHEVADRLASDYVPHGPRVQRVARLFDAVRYGDRPATAEEATTVLGLDDDLAGRR